MAKIQERLNKVGNTLVMEYRPDRRYCRLLTSVDYTTRPGMEVGEVLVSNLGTFADTAVLTDIVFAATAEFCVVIDDQVEEKIAADLALGVPTNSVELAVLYRGPAQVKRVGLAYAVTGGVNSPEVAADAGLEAQGIDILDKYSKRTESKLV